MTGGPLAGPASAYPTFSRPASICFSEENEVFPVLAVALTAGEVASANAGRWASIAAPAETPAIAKRRRREISVDLVGSMVNLSSCC
jgi:hypothetical protein